MRVAPVALYCYKRNISIADSDILAAEAAAITHGHELGYIPAAMFAHIIYRALEGNSVFEAVKDAVAYLPSLFENRRYISEAAELINKAVLMSGEDIDDLEAIRELGEGWVAEETLAIAVYCCLKYPNDFEKAVVAAVNHSGDSDSTGAVAGNIIGACLGAKYIPQKYLTGLELIDLTVDMALKLCQ